MGLLTKLKNTLSRSEVARDAADELAWHLDQKTQEYVEQGMPFEEARAAARRQMGNLTALKEETVESDLIIWLDSVRRDIAFAFRMQRRAAVVAFIVVLSLALGIGANSVVFTLVKQIVLDYLPVPEPNQLAILHSHEPEAGHVYSNGMNSSFSYPLYQDLNAATSHIFEGILAARTMNVSLRAHDTTETVHGALVSGNFFQVLKVTAWRGRLLTPSDDQKPGGSPVAVLSYGLWAQHFGRDPGIVNRTILVNKHPYAVVGITPPQFYGIDIGSRADLFLPISMKADVSPDRHRLMDRLDHWCSLVARLKPGVGMEEASAALAAIYPPLRDQDLAFMKSPSAEFRKNFSQKKIALSPGGRGYADLRNDLSEPLKILMGMVGIVLLIRIVNVANLLVARGIARQREMAIRLSLGAGKATVTRQMMIESFVLALLGGCLGVGVAYGGTPLLLHLLSFDLSTGSLSTSPDSYVLLFAAIVTVASGITFGLLPAWQSGSTDVGATLKAESSLGHTGRFIWLRRALVVGQVALSLILVTGAVLFSGSLQNLKNIKVGFNTSNLLKFRVNPQSAGYSPQRIKSFGEELRRALGILAGVESVSVATVDVLEDSDEGGSVTVEGMRRNSGQDDTRNDYLRNRVSPGYFSTMQIPVVAGRQFMESDSLPTSNVAIVNQTFVRSFLASKNPLGIHFGFGSGNVRLDQTIIGVVADSQHSTIRSKISPFVYLPYLTDDSLSALTFYVRIRSDERTVIPEIRNLVHHMDPDLPVNRLSTINEIINESLFVPRSLAFLSVAFALLAIVVAIVGLYGVMSYSVTRRYREFGIRMAIGASPRRVVAMVLRESAFLGIAGILCAIPCMLGTAAYLRSALYRVQPNDP